jgi:hypothetical protein
LKKARASSRDVKYVEDIYDWEKSGNKDANSDEDSDAEEVEDNSNTHCEICAS